MRAVLACILVIFLWSHFSRVYLTLSCPLLQSDMQRGVHGRLMDNSTSVREAAVELLGRFVLSRPQLTEQYYDMLIERILVSWPVKFIDVVLWSVIIPSTVTYTCVCSYWVFAIEPCLQCHCNTIIKMWIYRCWCVRSLLDKQPCAFNNLHIYMQAFSATLCWTHPAVFPYFSAMWPIALKFSLQSTVTLWA